MNGVIDFADGSTWSIPDWAQFTGEQPSKCRSCGASMLWVRSVKRGVPAPIDPDGGSHFATCPQADSWRKARG